MANTRFPRTIVGVGRKGTFAKTVMTHDLGDVTPEALMVEAKTAFCHLRCATEALLSRPPRSPRTSPSPPGRMGLGYRRNSSARWRSFPVVRLMESRRS